jgi:hypothetical protein
MDEASFLFWIQADVAVGAATVVGTLVFAVIQARRLGRTVEPRDPRAPIMVGTALWGGMLFWIPIAARVLPWWTWLPLLSVLELVMWGYVRLMQGVTDSGKARSAARRAAAESRGSRPPSGDQAP